jgi:hypothetical protein
MQYIVSDIVLSFINEASRQRFQSFDSILELSISELSILLYLAYSPSEIVLTKDEVKKLAAKLEAVNLVEDINIEEGMKIFIKEKFTPLDNNILASATHDFLERSKDLYGINIIFTPFIRMCQYERTTAENFNALH